MGDERLRFPDRQEILPSGDPGMGRTLLLLMLLFLSRATPLYAVELTHKFNSPEGFTMYLPGDWVEIPNEVLNEYSEKVSQLVPQIGKQVYDYGFQLTPVDRWMTHPYILVQVKRTGRIPEEELRKYRQINEVFSEHLGEVEKDISGILSNAKLGETLYDTENRILWISISFVLAETERVNAQIAVKLTEFGVIQMTGYATEDTFPSYQPLFQEMARQISLDNSIAYKPQQTDGDAATGGMSAVRVLKAVLRGAIFGGIIGLIIWLVKKRKRTS